MKYKHPNIVKKIMVDIDNFYQKELESMNVKFYCKDISKEQLIEEKDNSIDIILLNHVIEHINDICFFMHELSRLMKKNSKIYIRTPDLTKTKEAFYDDFTHIRPFTKKGLRHMMSTFGFNEIILFNSNNSTIRLEETLNLRLGFCGQFWFTRMIFNPKEIESAWIKL